MVTLYWHIGLEILERQGDQGWGAGVVERLAKDIHKEFPGMAGFSRTNLLYMRAFAEAYPEVAIVQPLVGQIPWGHNILLLAKVKSRSTGSGMHRQHCQRLEPCSAGRADRYARAPPPRQGHHEF